MLRVGTVVVGAEEFNRAIEFWSTALNYRPKREITADDDFMILVPIEGEGPFVAIDTSGSPAEPHPRVHLDLWTDSAAEQQAEVDRLVSLGATRVEWEHYPADPDYIVLADTEGNLFCIIDTAH